MKKWIVMLAVLVMFCLVGCGEKPMTAVYFQADDNSWYFADLDTDTIFSGTIPDKLTDENGKKLTEEDMTDGDIYLIYGDGIMLESFPGQYPGKERKRKQDDYRKTEKLFKGPGAEAGPDCIYWKSRVDRERDQVD